jgi:hypothetical protein
MNKLALPLILLVSSLAGAQTVTVGTLTTAQNGVTTTITVPVAVALPAATTATLPSYAYLSAQAGTGLGTAVIQSIGAAFTTIVLPTVVTDTATEWNPTSNVYVVPTTGTYIITSNLRLTDSPTPGISYGIGVGSTNADSPTFTWSTTSGIRNGFNTTQIVYLTAGTPLSLFAYVDSPKPLGIAGASISIKQLP